MISKEQACEIVKSKLGTLYQYDIDVFDGAIQQANIYGDFNWGNLWLVKVSELNKEPILKSSHLVLITKDTGEIVFNGSANDEG